MTFWLCVHRVFRVPGFLSSRRNWASYPLNRKRVLLLPLWVQGGLTHSLAWGGGLRDKRTDYLVLDVYYNPSIRSCAIQPFNSPVHETFFLNMKETQRRRITLIPSLNEFFSASFSAIFKPRDILEPVFQPAIFGSVARNRACATIK